MNIIISGWPGAGTTTLSLVLTELIKYRYLYGGGVFKYVAQKLTGQTSGHEFIKFEQNIGPHWDSIWEPYAKWKLEHTDKIIFEGKATGFFMEGENFFEIMLIAKVNARAGRAATDQRIDPQQTIMARDVVVRQRWIQEYGIDVYNPQQIQDNYDLVLDTSEITIEQEAEFIVSNLEEHHAFPESDLESQRKKIPEVVKKIKELGKDKFRALLVEKGLVVQPHEVLKELVQQFPQEIDKLPEELRDIIKGDAY